MDVDLLVAGGVLVTEHETFPADVAVHDGRVAAILEPGTAGVKAARVLEARWARHRLANEALRAGLLAMGLALFADPAHRAPMITLVRVPAGVDEAAVRRLLLDDFGIEIMAAFGPLNGRVWRIGLMGYNARLECALAVLGALEQVLATEGFRAEPGAGLQAALAHMKGAAVRN